MKLQVHRFIEYWNIKRIIPKKSGNEPPVDPPTPDPEKGELTFTEGMASVDNNGDLTIDPRVGRMGTTEAEKETLELGVFN